jgi:hypothetical protein
VVEVGDEGREMRAEAIKLASTSYVELEKMDRAASGVFLGRP